MDTPVDEVPIILLFTKMSNTLSLIFYLDPPCCFSLCHRFVETGLDSALPTNGSKPNDSIELSHVRVMVRFYFWLRSAVAIFHNLHSHLGDFSR